MDDQTKLREYLELTPCKACDGKGGFLDTTYDRTGEWCICNGANGCGGTGMIYNRKKLQTLLNLTVIGHG